MRSIKLNLSPLLYFPAAVGFGYLLLFFWLLPGYLDWNANVYAGFLLLPYSCTWNKGKFSLGYLIPALLALTLALLVPVRTTLFLAIVFTALLFIERNIGKLNAVFIFLLILISPVFKYFLNLIDFPMRLWLSGQVAVILGKTGINAVAAGNQIEVEGDVFSVDPACAGLHMLVISLILCMFLLVYQQRKLEKQLHLISILLLFLITICLNVLSNFFRITFLVIFKIMPGNIYHDLMGILCLLCYVMFPLIKAMPFVVNRFGLSIEKPQFKRWHTSIPAACSGKFHFLKENLLHGIFLALLFFVAANTRRADDFTGRAKTISLPGFKSKELDGGISKFENKDALVYVKPTVFYAPEHDPKICWTGSGYVFKSIRQENWKGLELYTAVLNKGKDKIYAAWWFDNGSTQTTNQLLWRWKGIKGERPFYLINVNATDRGILKTQVEMIRTHLPALQ